MTHVLITGVRGKTGRSLAGSLADRPGVEVRGGSTRPAALAIPGVEPVALDWDDPATWSRAADGVDAVFLVRPDRPDAPALVAGFVAALPRDARVVLLSEAEGGAGAADDWGLRVEAAVRGGGRPWTVLRPGWFMQVLTDERFFRADVAERGVLPLPSGGAALAWIDVRDIAAVAEAALLEEGHDGATYELSGPEALNLARTAEILGEALGRPVVHDDLDVEESVAGVEGFDRELTVTTYERVRAGRFAEVTGTVERVTGRPSRDLATFAAQAAHELAG